MYTKSQTIWTLLLQIWNIDVEQYGGVSRSSEMAEIPELGEPSQTIDMPDVAADAKFIRVVNKNPVPNNNIAFKKACMQI